MKCPNCGSELEPGKIYCEHCGHEIQIVPDYDPLDEVLIGQEEPEEMKPDSFPVLEESRTTVGKGRKMSGDGKRTSLCFRYKSLLFLMVLLICGCAFTLSYSAMTSDNNYSYQLRKGRQYEKKREYEKAIMYLRPELGIEIMRRTAVIRKLCVCWQRSMRRQEPKPRL